MQKKLLPSGNIFKRTDGRWNGVVWYMDEQGKRKKKFFCGTTKPEVKTKITDYIAAFNQQLMEADEVKKTLSDSMGSWLRVFKFPSVECGTYDRLECTADHQNYPLIGDRVVGDITSADIKLVLDHWMNKGYAYTTVKKAYNHLTDYFRYLSQQELLPRNPMAAAPMIKQANFLAAQGKENRATFETVTMFSPEEIKNSRPKLPALGTTASVSTSKRDIPLNQAAVDTILDLRAERYFGENSPLIPDENGSYTRPVNFRKRYYRILKAAGLERKGLHSLRHTFATILVNGIKRLDGSIKSLSPRQVADLLGHSTSEIIELYYVKKDTSRLAGITAGFEL